jgi:hypothetical protein
VQGILELFRTSDWACGDNSRNKAVSLEVEMVSVSELEITGFKGQSVGGTFHKQDAPTDHLAMIFPGYGYSCDRPLLYYPLQILLDQGLDVLQVNYAFANKPGFWQSGEETRAIWFGTDAAVAMRSVFEKGDYRHITLIGKSLGTLAVGHIAATMPDLTDVRAIMLTPLLKNPRLVQQIIGFKGDILLVVGTGDSLHAPDTLQVIRTARVVEVIEVEGGDHSLEIKGDAMQSLDTLVNVMVGVNEFFTK